MKYISAIKWTVIFLALAGMFNAAMDTVQHHYSESIFKQFKNEQFFNPAISWKNKWQINTNGEVVKGKEKFIGSSSGFVMFTDFWHLSKTAMILLMILGIVSYKSGEKDLRKFTDLIIFYLTFTASFNLFYDVIFKIH